MMNVLLFSSLLFLDDFDQAKLADLMGNLPTTIREKTVSELETPVKGFKVTSVFPKTDGPFQFTCESSYYNGSPYASFAKCEVRLDEKHQELEKGYDEYKVTITDPELVGAFNKVIPYGRNSFKEFRSFGKEPGTTFDGKRATIFYYYVRCTDSACDFKFPIKQNPES